MTQDLLFLVAHQGWEVVSLCGYSMGGERNIFLNIFSAGAKTAAGVIAQQLLLLPYLETNPVPTLPFRVSHVILAATRSIVLPPELGVKYDMVPGKQYSIAERMGFARNILADTFDPDWIQNNAQTFEDIFNKVIRGG
jgi:hypothetical protein